MMNKQWWEDKKKQFKMRRYEQKNSEYECEDNKINNYDSFSQIS